MMISIGIGFDSEPQRPTPAKPASAADVAGAGDGSPPDAY
jgi:hypothetical protein